MRRRLKNNKGKGRALTIKKTTLNNFEFTSVIHGSFADSNSTTSGVGFSFFLNYPTYIRNGAGSIVQCSNVANLLANEQKMFDEYKVLSLTVRYVPFLQASILLSNFTTAVGNSTPTPVAPQWDPTIIVSQDNDDSANLTSIAKALSGQGMAIFTRQSPRGLITLAKMTQVDKIEKMKWLNLGAIVPNVSTPPDPNNPVKLASVKVWTGIGVGNAYPLASTSVGVYVLSWLIKTKGVYTLG